MTDRTAFVPIAVTVDGTTTEIDRPGRVVIGSGADADLTVHDDRVSRRHAVLRWDDSGWVYRDTGSTNGSYFAGNRVEEMPVEGAVEIRLAHPTDGPALQIAPAVVRTAPAAGSGDASADGGAGRLTAEWGARRTVLDPPGPALVGRDPDATVSIDAPGVSFRHGRIQHDRGTWSYIDVGSTHGSFVAGDRIERVDITGSTIVRLGDPERGEALQLAPGGPGQDVPAGERPPVRRAAGAAPAPPGRIRPGEARPVAVGRSSLTVGDLGGVSQVHRPATGRVRIGRAPENDVVIDDLTVSRHHAELRGDPSTGFELADLGSFNGTFVNGVLAERAHVQDGDIISVGRHRLLLVGGVLEEYVDTGDVRFEVSDLAVRVPSGPTLLDGVSFALERRSLMAVVGPSGAGKSTLLNALTGFRPADEGTVLYDGRDLYASYADLRNRIGYVPQDDILHTELTVRLALEYAARLRFPPDVEPSQRAARIDEVLEELGLTQRSNVPINRLSGGQRKRASVAIELLTKPSLLFLDEPTSGLDPGYERALTELLRELADGGRTIVVVTHSVQSLDLCDRMIFLAPGGRTAFFGPPSEARDYFRADNYAEIFMTLEHEAERDWTEQFRSTDAYRRFVSDPIGQRDLDEAPALPERAEATPVHRQGWWRQFSTLTRRYLSVLGSDRKLIGLLLLQAPLLGLLMLAALPPGELRPLEPGELARLSQANAVLAVLVIGVTGLGIANAVREIVKESPVYRRERSVGLSISAYIASKAFVLTLITAAQSAVLVVIAVQRQGSGWGSALIEPGILELSIGFIMAGIAAMGLGLLVSAVATTTDRAASILPILLILQLIVSGAFKNVLEKPVLREASYLASAQWGFSAGASTIDLNSLQSFNDCLSADLSIGSQQDVQELFGCSVLERGLESAADRAQLEDALVDVGLSRAEASALLDEAEATRESVPTVETAGDPPLRFWEQEPGDWLMNIGVLAGFTIVELGGAWWVLRRRDPQVMSAG